MKNIKYIPKIAAALSFLLLLIIFMLLFGGRRMAFLRPVLLLDYFPDFYQHVSNLCISYLLFSAVGYVWLLMGVKLSNIAVLGLVVILANFIYELWLPFLNTCDVVDAYYGCFGALIALVFLMLVKGFGLNKKPGEGKLEA